MALATNTTPGEIQLAGDLAGNNDATAPELTTLGVVAGQYNYPKITVDVKGRITTVTAGDPAEFSALLPTATASVAGIMQAGTGLSVSATATSGYQEVTFNTSIDGSESSGLNSCASYALDIQVDFGTTQEIVLIDVDLSTINNVIAEINKELTDATASVVSGKLRITSDSTGQSTVVEIIADNIFSCMFGYVSIGTPVTGTASCQLNADIATVSNPGVVQIGSGIDVDGAGVISTAIATTTSLGTVSIGTGISVTAGGEISAAAVADATTSTKGIVQIGSNIDVASGIISVPAATNTTLGVCKSGNPNNISITAGAIDVGTDIALLNVSNNWTTSQVVTSSTLTATGSPATIAVDAEASNVFETTLTENVTLNNPTNLAAGGRYSFVITQDATGSRTMAFGSAYKFKNGSDKILTTAGNSIDILMCVSDGTNLYCSLAKDFS